RRIDWGAEHVRVAVSLPTATASAASATFDPDPGKPISNASAKTMATPWPHGFTWSAVIETSLVHRLFAYLCVWIRLLTRRVKPPCCGPSQDRNPTRFDDPISIGQVKRATLVASAPASFSGIGDTLAGGLRSRMRREAIARLSPLRSLALATRR